MRRRERGVRFAFGLFLCLACWGCGGSGGGDGSPMDGGTASQELGFVVSSFGFVYPELDSEPCPGGLNLGPIEMQQSGETPIPDDCANPEANEDPGFRTMQAPGRLDGFDLDGIASVASAPEAGECAHDDFSGFDGEDGFDLQLWRAIGCVRGFQEGEIAEAVVDQAVRNGSMTILLRVRGVDDLVNDDSVSVQLFGSTDSPPIGADGSVLPYGTMSVHQDVRYHGDVAPGEIVDGVLVAGPMEIRLRLNIQIVDGNLTLRHAWVRFEIDPDGTAHGRIFGYQTVEEFYDVFGKQAGPAGAAALSYTCTGLYAALKSEADGDYDPDTNTCSSLSLAYEFEALPAFVVP